MQEKTTDAGSVKQNVHFIRKKQGKGNISIKRQCGVSYIKESESQQKNVNHIYKKLPHLIIQANSELNLDLQQDALKILFVDQLIDSLLFKQKFMVITIFESEDEQLMREYILYPDKRLQIVNKIYLCNNINDLWMFWLNNHFICFHFIFDQKLLIDQPLNFQLKDNNINQQLANFIYQSDVQLGINVKKSLSGLKSYLKTLNTLSQYYIKRNKNQQQQQQQIQTENQNIDFQQEKKKKEFREQYGFLNEQLIQIIEDSKININTCSLRIELYVPEKQWKLSNALTKTLLTLFINTCKEKLEQIIHFQTNMRFKFDVQTLDSNNNQFQIYLVQLQSNFQKSDLYIEKKFILDQKIEQQINDDPKNIDIQQFVQRSTENIIEMFFFQDINNFRINNNYYLSNFTQNFNLKKFYEEFIQKNNTIFQTPLYFISTRDCFAFDLIVKQSQIEQNNRKYFKNEYYFNKEKVPINFKNFIDLFPDLRVGVTTYHDFFSHEELLNIEQETFQTELKCFNNNFLQMTAQMTGTGEKIRRTKFFFGNRYMWTRLQLAEPYSEIGAGVRSDVSLAPSWCKSLIEDPLTNHFILQSDFINSIALNVYHDGKEGLAQHFDDALRFKQPIYSVRLFSDCRLSFGSQLYGFCNGAFSIPLPRGCVCVLEENSFAANGVKHCIRPCDMTGKSAAIIMRQMHKDVVSQAHLFRFHVEMPSYLSTLTYLNNSESFQQQNKQEAQAKLNKGKKVVEIIGD